jgi:hypothetical protein
MIIIAGKNRGRLGNRLTIFAHFISCAIENSLTIINLSFNEYACFFESLNQDILCRYPKNRLTLLNGKKLRQILYEVSDKSINLLSKFEASHWEIIKSKPGNPKFILSNNPEFFELARKKIVICQGYFFRDYENVAKHADKIKEYFCPIKEIQIKVDNLMNNIRKNSEIVIGIHIRQGDYEQFQGGKFFFTTTDYIKIMQKARSLFINKNIAFLICSDTEQNKSYFSEFNVTFGNNHIVEDLYSLSQCDYLIGAPSSYSRWASFYGDVPLCVIDRPDKDISLDKFEINWTLAG